MSGNLSLFDTIRCIVQEELMRARQAELAVVQEQHPHADDADTDNYACTVALRDSGIVLKQVPVATPHIGCAAIPEIGELVLVQFIGGDINAPVISGRLYNDEDRPPANAAQQMITHLPASASAEEALHLELNSGDTKSAVLNIGSAVKVLLADDDPAVTVNVGDGAAVITITPGGEITIESQSDMKFISAANLDLEASGDLNLKGATINLN
ncbi:phage baseplate assembly protein V [Teredinibacter turnerae]|uniref:phage baseplate assembly protein V n=1 Tax=Teredinibacter turnerae TaxID=2426 RepID=UPI0003784A71|nr:phage baseplate assembly protein V [Teredinibacter turnerae]